LITAPRSPLRVIVQIRECDLSVGDCSFARIFYDAHKTEGEYRTTHKKVVSNFSKQQMGRISFLNPSEQCRLP
jgi:hypothetical protein